MHQKIPLISLHGIKMEQKFIALTKAPKQACFRGDFRHRVLTLLVFLFTAVLTSVKSFGFESGSVTANTTGNITAIVDTGNITANTTGNITANTTGNITANTTGNITDNTTGNTTAYNDTTVTDECEDMTWLGTDGECQPGIADCITKASITGCSKCKGQGTLSGTTPQ